MQAKLIADDRFEIFGDFYRSAFPIAELPKWLSFYREMFKRYGHIGYKETADALAQIKPEQGTKNKEKTDEKTSLCDSNARKH